MKLHIQALCFHTKQEAENHYAKMTEKQQASHSVVGIDNNFFVIPNKMVDKFYRDTKK